MPAQTYRLPVHTLPEPESPNMQSARCKPNQRTLALAAGIFSGIVFGIYWIPLRLMSDAGISGLWAVMVFNVISFILVTPIIFRQWNSIIPGRMRLHATACVCGLGYVLYIGAFLYTEVIRVLVLFYLMPIWGFALARIFIGEAITPARTACMVLGISGLMVICGIEQGFPFPSNAGDWMALLSGVVWAGVSLLILTDKHEPVNYGATFLFWGAVWALLLATFATGQGVLPVPSWTQLPEILIWMVPLAILVIIPAAFATLYAPSQLNPGVVGLLFMTEISVGTATAAWLAGEPFGLREVAGVILITLAGITEPIVVMRKHKTGA